MVELQENCTLTVRFPNKLQVIARDPSGEHFVINLLLKDLLTSKDCPNRRTPLGYAHMLQVHSGSSSASERTLKVFFRLYYDAGQLLVGYGAGKADSSAFMASL